WPGLAGEDEAGVDFPGLQREIDRHLALALGHAAAACAAHAARAGIGKLYTRPVRRVEDRRILLAHGEAARDAVEHDVDGDALRSDQSRLDRPGTRQRRFARWRE